MKISMPKIDKLSQLLKRLMELLKRLSNRPLVYVMFLILGIVVFFIIAEIGRLTSQRFKKSAINQQEDDRAKEKADFSTDESLNLPFYQFPRRDMFSRMDALPTELAGFSLESIETESIPIVYKGYINLEGDAYIAQVNKDSKTYFLRRDSWFDNFEVQDISKERVVFKNRNGESLILENSQPLYKKERVAMVSDNNGYGKYKLFKGALLKDYRVLQVGPDRILLVSRIKGKKVLLKIEK